MLTGLYVRYHLAGNSKWKFRSTQPSEGAMDAGQARTFKKVGVLACLFLIQTIPGESYANLPVYFCFGGSPLPPLAVGHWPDRHRKSARARSFRVLRMTGKSIIARRTRGMARDWCGRSARRRANRRSRGATTKRESGWTRDAGVSLLWDAAKTPAMPAARVVERR